MKLVIESYNAALRCHFCRDEEGHEHRVDFQFYDLNESGQKALAGKTVECDYLFTSEELAMNPRLCEPAEKGKP